MKKIFCCILVLASLAVCSCRSITNAVTGIDADKKEVILSFDDGPNANGDTTARLLDVLQKYNVRAMFALIGKNAEQNIELVQRIHNEGHIIVNHGYSGRWAISMKNDEFRENLRKGEEAIAVALGDSPQPKLYRPHGGFYHQRHKRIWLEEGWEMVGGNIRVYDATIDESGRQRVIERVINKTIKKGGGVILLHDGNDTYYRMERELERNPSSSYNRAWIPDAVEEIIVALLENGYQM